MFETMTRWMSGEPSSVPSGEPPPAAVPVYTDQSVARLDAVRRELITTRAALASADARWRTLKARGDDPEIEQGLADLRPRLLDLRQQVDRLATEEAATDQKVRDTAARVAAYAALADETRGWLQPVLDALPSADVLTKAYRTSRGLDRLADELMARTGDRQFRRPLVDPYRLLREALTERVRLVERQREVHHFEQRAGAADATTKTGTEAR